MSRTKDLDLIIDYLQKGGRVKQYAYIPSTPQSHTPKPNKYHLIKSKGDYSQKCKISGIYNTE